MALLSKMRDLANACFINKQSEKDVFNSNLALINNKAEKARIQSLMDKSSTNVEPEEESKAVDRLKDIQLDFTQYNIDKAKKKNMDKINSFKVK